jgi:hypothetical protein
MYAQRLSPDLSPARTLVSVRPLRKDPHTDANKPWVADAARWRRAHLGARLGGENK